MDDTKKNRNRSDDGTASPLAVDDDVTRPLGEEEDDVIDIATRTGRSSPSGNPGANNPGVGNLGAGDVGVSLEEPFRGYVKEGNVGTGASRTMGAGGIAGTGAIGGEGGAPGETGTTEGASGVTGTGTAGGTDAPPPPRAKD